MEIIDKSNMRKTILEFPKQFRAGLKAAENVKIENLKLGIENLIVCGMGGSALPADILKMWLEEKKINFPLKIHRNYGLPYGADKNHLVICISYSGNTEETLSAFNEARKKRLKIAAIASGGKLAQLCKKNGVPLAEVPRGFLPRMALGFQFAALIKILANCRLIRDNLKDIYNLENTLKPGALENQGKKFALKLKSKIPLIYASEKWGDLARIWKLKFNETSKTPAFSNCFPELNHSELVSFENDRYPISIIMLRNAMEHPRIKKRMELTSAILKERGVNVDIVDIMGKDMLYKMFSSILLADWASYYLALEYGIDPTPVKLNDEFKKRLMA